MHEASPTQFSINLWFYKVVDVLFNDLLADLPTILNTSTTNYYMWMIDQGQMGSREVVVKHMPYSYTCIMGSLMLEMAQKVVELLDNISTSFYEALQPGSLC